MWLKMRFFSMLFLLPTLVSASGLSGLLPADDQFLPVDEAFQFSYQQNGSSVELNWQVADEYYLYRDKFKFKVNGAEMGTAERPAGILYMDEYFGETQVYYHQAVITVPVSSISDNAELTVTYQGCAAAGLCYPPTRKTVYLQPQPDEAAAALATDTPAADGNATTERASGVPMDQGGFNALLSEASVGWALLLFFILGVGLAFTPCVFPMYPILSGILVGQGDKLTTRRAFSLSLVYVQGMAITYAALGLVVATAGLKFQAALQHPAVLLSLGGLFVVLSLSMFGAFNFQLPSHWVSRISNVSNSQKSGSYIGVGIMGVLSGLVASPCTTAPLSGALLYVAQSGDLVLGGLALYLLSVGMGLPLLIIGTSGGKLLPKAGAWMDSIKMLFGFVLLAAALLLVGRLLPAIVESLLWALLITVTLLFLAFTKYGAERGHFTARITVAVLALTVGGWTAINGLKQQPATITGQFINVANVSELQQQVDAAAAAGKPVMLDLYADWCVACKEFEQKTFPAEHVVQRLDQFVLLKADVTDNSGEAIALLESLGVLGLPTLVFYDPSAAELATLRVTGFQGPDRFAEHLDRVLAE
ncbi:protein-disulfide reductase DsbD [Corallincola holothuriorum]|uniref:Thiol:disulfide interchange protein DsbD n=1 Tax=Corallincola holothuriorum TaxID=2282215 RepID=A0A368N2Q8_9GAMM|nr:protein-disulfide reductase DsbD [Corallincola holothuriorum]RCU43811.1 protein-disulfide reductase DsbD [Corallincola holothuriorum]